MASDKKPFLVTVEEARKKKMVVWATGESDAAWKAVSLCQQGEISMEAQRSRFSCDSVREADNLDLRMYPHYGKEDLK